MILAFINGLQNTAFAKILTELKPKTVDEAYTLIKHEKTDENQEISYVNALINSPKQNTCNCSIEIQNLNNKVKKLEQIINSLTQQRYQRNNNNNNTFKSNSIICFNCNMAGHIARNCRKRPYCKNCGMTGHISENCRRKLNPNVRNLTNDHSSNVSEPSTTEVMDNACELEDTEKDDGRIYSISKNNVSFNHRKEKKYPKHVQSWSQYIEGSGGKPKKAISTVNDSQSRYTKISYSNPEPAKNKPIVCGKIFGVTKNLLLDTGAEANVIDFNFLKSLNGKFGKVKIYRKHSNLKCANGSPLSVVGYSVLPVNLKGKEFSIKFTVVDSIFPNVILGMQSMRKMKLIIEPLNGQAKIIDLNGESNIIPFISSSEN